ncbi:MAG: tRNA pseudouridine(38-40) synthase TruA [Schleiferiaceae bacterium]|nr:tRNA pseudouridine(38-40) synthase TruA [Schleiferiaceae bacterium]
MRYFIQLSYNGSAFHGWQIQNNAPSVQETIEQALCTALRLDTVAVTGAGRTDTGVHASDYYAHFEVKAELPMVPTALTKSLNGILPDEIAIARIFPVAPDMHARFSAITRSYAYRLYREKNPFLRGRAFHFHKVLNLQKMQAACQILFEYEDFACFAKSNHGASTTLCTIYQAHWEQQGNELIFRITANRFLRNMVRAIVGTLLEVGLEKITLSDFRNIIETKDRRKAGFSVPPEGLYLTQITYPKNFDQHANTFNTSA